MTTAYLNTIATGAPDHQVHQAFVPFARQMLASSRERSAFDRMALHAQIQRRYSVLSPRDATATSASDLGVYSHEGFPSTGERMKLYERHAAPLAIATTKKLGIEVLQTTHLITTSCTGMYAPGLDLDLARALELSPSVERTCVGFMGCYAAVSGLKLANHIVRSQPEAKVLLVNLELCSLHLQKTSSLRSLLSFLLFADGCAASLISAEPHGLAIGNFHCAQVPETSEHITWKIRDQGFEMFLSGHVPAAVARGVAKHADTFLEGRTPDQIDWWAVHPGGRSVLDAVAEGLGLDDSALDTSRSILRNYGNMSSATVMFVLAEIARKARRGEQGCAMSFGPGLTAETMTFRKV